MDIIIIKAGLLRNFKDVIYTTLRKQSTSGISLEDGMAWILMLGPPWTMVLTMTRVGWLMAMVLIMIMI